MNKMEILTSKWMMIACIVITFGVILLILGKKSVHSEIIVNAPKAKIANVIKNVNKIFSDRDALTFFIII